MVNDVESGLPQTFVLVTELLERINDLSTGLDSKASIVALAATNIDVASRTLQTTTDTLLSKQLVQDFYSTGNQTPISITATSSV